MSGELRSAYQSGAIAKLVYRVVDELGHPIANARAHVWFRSYSRPGDNADWVVLTDTNGVVTAEHRTNEHFGIVVEKEGYYPSRATLSYFDSKRNFVQGGKWQPFGVEREMVLKRRGRAQNCTVFAWKLRNLKLPAQDQWMGFDLEEGQWCHPWGNGKNEDVLVRFTGNVRNAYGDFSYKMEMSFTNCTHAGAYVVGKDLYSALKTAHCADTNRVFMPVLTFFSSVTPGGVRKKRILENSEYLVFRTRTSVDADGKLQTAHFGMISGPLLFDARGITLSDGCFNRTPNDINIEDSRELRERDRFVGPNF